MEIANVATKDLVDELKKRQGVEVYTVEPYSDFEVAVNGPAIVLVVID